MSSRPEIAKRFARDIADHAMTVLHDDGLYRHLRFQRQVWRPPLAEPLKSSMYWFDLITAPGMLTFQGDGEAFVFHRLRDMFEFFRGPVGEINPSYWQEKVVSGRENIRTFDEQVFRDRVLEAFTDALPDGVPLGTGRAVREQVLEDDDAHYEAGAVAALARFEHDGFTFNDTWEWSIRDYDWWFLWACHAIVWGIAYYDTGSRPAMPVRTAKALRPRVRPEPRVIAGSQPKFQTGPRVGVRPVVDVQLPALPS